jgi:hypothetical protein
VVDETLAINEEESKQVDKEYIEHLKVQLKDSLMIGGFTPLDS